MFETLVPWLGGFPLIWVGLGASFLAGAATGLGALPLVFIRQISQKTQDTFLGFGAGVMLAASSFSLIIPGIEAAQVGQSNPWIPALIVGTGILLGGLFLRLSHEFSPHEHFIKGPEGADPQNLARVWLFVIAIALHNLPEGLAVGVGFGSGDLTNGISLALGIGLQNIPEGLVVAAALLTEKYTRAKAFWIALGTGLLEPIGALLGVAALSFAATLLPWGLAFAAGAMLYVISHEIIPESHSKGFEKEATAGLMVGFVTMMFLDVTLG